MNLLVAYEVYLVAVLGLRGLIHWRSALGSLRLVQRTPQWPHLLAATRRHKHLLFTLPNLLWTLLFAALLATYAAFLHLVYPGASVTWRDLAADPRFWLPALAAAATMFILDVVSLGRGPRRNPARTRRRLDRAERLLAWGGPVGRLVALPRLRHNLFRASLALNGWLQRSLLRLTLRAALALVLWLPWATGP